ncbi:hypothetical protein NQ315_012995 [Exocentrus adspersus]|uniref:DNA-directed DNA polymerase n=1 Tax=Exocentrus adspersus TaxID=1586481 RepID=A0AAV8VT42_9CUCU|nr:hypothetical protein NQ315_012995 [Exocentrus adspersus]
MVKDCSSVYMNLLISDVRRINNNHFKNSLPMTPLTPQERRRHYAASVCFLCGDKFLQIDAGGPGKGKYRGAAHSRCNLLHRRPKFIPVFLHNMNNYDIHIFVQEAAATCANVSVIPENKEKYISFMAKIKMDEQQGGVHDAEDIDDEDEEAEEENNKRKPLYFTLRFLDSFRFMACSLEKLASYLKEDKMIETKRAFPRGEKFNLVRHKGVFPYKFIDSYEKLESTLELPTADKFYSTLTESSITEEDYQHAQLVWKTFKCRNIGEYSDIYLKTDVLLLTDVFEVFRDVCMEVYGLEAASFITLPGLSWQAMMKYTKVRLELLTDVDMLHFIRKSIRGGVSQCSHRHATANNKYMPRRSDEEDFQHLAYNSYENPRYLMYLDANNLYGLSLSQYLPYAGFKWLTDEEVARLNISSCSNPCSDIGFILEVDLGYPTELHDDHDELPYCPQNIIPPNGCTKQSKLILNLSNKEKYVIHYRNLWQALQHGLKLNKIHRILSFKQSDWLRVYIDLNTKR